MRTHAAMGVQITQHVRWFTEAHLGVIRHHHERWDGTGYPDRLAGEQIPLLARVIALGDVFDALINDRPYRKALTAGEALSIIKETAGTHFDPALTAPFVAVVDRLSAFLRDQWGATEFKSVNWLEHVIQVRVETPEGSRWVHVQYKSGW